MYVPEPLASARLCGINALVQAALFALNGECFPTICPFSMGTKIVNWERVEGRTALAAPALGARVETKKVKTELNTSHHGTPLNEAILTGDRAAADFVRGMSHELHTPLHVIIGLCQVLERDRNTSLSPMQRDAIGRMERNAQALLKTVNHLLGCLRSGHFE